MNQFPANQDAQHLQPLSIFHYVVGGLMGCCACIPVIHLILGIALLTCPQSFLGPRHDEFPPTLFGVLFTVIPAAIILLGWATAICVILAGRFLARRVHYTYCLVVAAIACLFTPAGTVLGVFTILVLMRPSVKAMFEEQAGGSLPQGG